MPTLAPKQKEQGYQQLQKQLPKASSARKFASRRTRIKSNRELLSDWDDAS
jgi:hypothetical protein